MRKSAGIKSFNELNGATICVTQGSTTELNLADYFRSHKLTYQLATFADPDETRNAYDAGRCDAWTNDRGSLAARSLALKNRADNVMLPETISKEPIGPMVKTDDTTWFHVVRWTSSAVIAAEELGVNSANVDDLRKTGNQPRAQAPARRRRRPRSEARAVAGLVLQHRQASRQLRRDLRAQCR